MPHPPDCRSNRLTRSIQPALILTPDTPIDQAIAALNRAAIAPDAELTCTDCILVQSAAGLLGLLGSQEILRAVAAGQSTPLADRPVTLANWMRSDLICLQLADLAADLDDSRLLARLQQGVIAQSVLPVLNDQQQAIGVISAGAIAQILLMEKQEAVQMEPLPARMPDAQMELALQVSEDKYRLLAENSSDVIYLTDASSFPFVYLYLNPAVETVFRRPHEFFTVENPGRFLSCMHPDDRAAVEQSFQQAIAQQQNTLELYYRILRPDGEVRYLRDKIIFFWDTTGQLQLFQGIAADLTELQQAEVALERLNQELEQRVQERTQALLTAQNALNQREQEVRSLVQNSPDLILRLDRQMRYLFVNPAMEQIMQRSAAEIIGKTSYDMGFSAEVLDLWRTAYDRAAATRRQQKLEFLVTTPSGEIYFQSKIVPEFDRYGAVASFLVVSRDISEQKQFEQALQAAYRELEQRVEERTAELRAAKEAAEAASSAKSTFLANMSHELRTPLNAILGFTQLLSRDVSLTATQFEQIQIINRSGEHLLNLINDILEMSKIEAGRIALHPIAFDLHYLLATLKEMLGLRSSSKGLELRFDLERSLPQYIYADEGKLRQVLINLLSNAIKFTAQGSVILRVQCLSEQHCLRFQVEDTGCGIAPEEMGSLFEPFVQTRSGQTAPEGGTGLGLPISREFVRIMGGELTVSSVVNQGSIFTFDLPVTLAIASASAEPPAARQIVGLKPNQPLYRILVAEDKEENRTLLVMLLREIGFAVAEATNGQEAIAKWQSWQPHLIWMDMRMPVLNGAEATQRIRALEAERGRWGDGEMGRWGDGEMGRWGDGEMGSSEANEASEAADYPALSPDPRVPAFPHSLTPSSPHPLIPSSPHPSLHSPTKIIALTASAFEDDRARMLAIGCDDFVPKPVDPELLLEKLAEHLPVEYVYVDRLISHPFHASDSSLVPNGCLTVEQLQGMPPQWLDRLYHACLQLNSSRVLRLVDQIPPEQEALAKILAFKVDEFQFEEIMNLTELARFSQENQ